MPATARLKTMLTPTERKIYGMLSERAGETISREELCRAIWGEKVHVVERAVDTHLSNLRKKIQKSSSTAKLTCTPRSGYCLRF